MQQHHKADPCLLWFTVWTWNKVWGPFAQNPSLAPFTPWGPSCPAVVSVRSAGCQWWCPCISKWCPDKRIGNGTQLATRWKPSSGWGDSKAKTPWDWKSKSSLLSNHLQTSIFILVFQIRLWGNVTLKVLRSVVTPPGDRDRQFLKTEN